MRKKSLYLPIVVAILVCTAFSGFSYNKIKRCPQATETLWVSPVIKVLVPVTGKTFEETEQALQDVNRVLRTPISKLPGIERLSTSRQNNTFVISIRFAPGLKSADCLNKVQNTVTQAQKNLPEALRKKQLQVRPSPPAMGKIQPDPYIQNIIGEYRALCRSIPASATKLSRREQFDLWQKKLLPLRFLAQQKREVLLEQLLWRYAVKRDMAWFEFGFLVTELNLTGRRRELRTVRKYVMSPDPGIRYVARDMLNGAFRQYGTDETLSHFASGEAIKTRPDEFTALLFHRAPMEMVTLCIRSDGSMKEKLLSKEQRKELSWAIRQVDTGLWKRMNGFLERKKVPRNPYQSGGGAMGDPDAVNALASLSGEKQPWYARLFALQIMATHPDYQDEAILLRLSKDPDPIISRLAKKTLALNLAPQLDRAVNTGDIEAVKKLLAKPGVKINAGLPLIKAVQRGDLKMARFLLEQGADPDWRGAVQGGFPLKDGALMVAVSMAQFELVRLLVNHGAKLEWTHAGQTPQSSMYTAVVSKGRRNRHGRPDWPTQKVMLELLVELGADVNGTRPNLGQPAERAIALGNNKALRFLIDHKADLSMRTGQSGTPLLVSAAFFGNIEAMKLLLKQGADINVQSRREKLTALMSAARAHHVDAVRWLLEHQADVTLKDRTSRTALDYSKQTANFTIPARTKREKKRRDSQKAILELLKANPTKP